MRTHTTNTTLDLDEVAGFLKVHVETARELLDNGQIPGAKIGRAWVVVEGDVMDYLRKQVTQQTAERRNRWELSTSLPNVGYMPVRRSRRLPLPRLIR